MAEKRKVQRKAKREREKERKKEKDVKKKEEDDKERFVQLSDREKVMFFWVLIMENNVLKYFTEGIGCGEENFVTICYFESAR